MLNRRELFWWKLREIWHMPHFWHQGMKSPVWWDEPNYYWICWYKRDVRMFLRTFWRHTRAATWRSYWALRYWQPLRCNGDCGGWRTKFCDWLENKARSYEEHDG